MWHNIRNLIVQQIGDANLCNRCRDGDCEVSLVGVPDKRIVINAHKAMDRGVRGAKRCDCILFVQGSSDKVLAAVPVELKGGSVQVNHVVEQLQAGAQFADEVIQQLPREGNFRLVCIPVLVHNGKLTIRHTHRLDKRRIKFDGRKWRIAIARCGPEGGFAQLFSD